MNSYRMNTQSFNSLSFQNPAMAQTLGNKKKVFKLDQRYALSSRIRQLSHMYLNFKIHVSYDSIFRISAPSVYILILFTLSFLFLH